MTTPIINSNNHILLLVATQTGNAERMSDAVQSGLETAGLDVEMVDMWDAYPEMLAEVTLVVIVTSTWGEGELPDNAAGFAEDLEELAPALDHLSYAIVGLGDHSYDPHFCEALHIFDRLFGGLGAARLGALLEFDEGPTQEDFDTAIEWSGTLATHYLSSS